MKEFTVVAYIMAHALTNLAIEEALSASLDDSQNILARYQRKALAATRAAANLSVGTPSRGVGKVSAKTPGSATVSTVPECRPELTLKFNKEALVFGHLLAG